MELRWVWGVVALCAAAGFASGDSESVIVGTEANFDDVITTNSFTLVEFCTCFTLRSLAFLIRSRDVAVIGAG